LRWAKACSIIRKWKVAPHRVRRLAHSLKRDIGAAAAYRHVDSPVSMTSPRTTLTCGQSAPLLHRFFRGATVHLGHIARTACFFGAICGSGPITSLTSRSTGTVGKADLQRPLWVVNRPLTACTTVEQGQVARPEAFTEAERNLGHSDSAATGTANPGTREPAQQPFPARYDGCVISWPWHTVPKMLDGRSTASCVVPIARGNDRVTRRHSVHGSQRAVSRE
jgi:hypothetical protein